MKQLSFYLSGERPVDQVLPIIMRGAMAKGQRVLVVADDEADLDRLGAAMWNANPAAFVANGKASDGHAARQPILLSTECIAANGAAVIALADGRWREEAEGFERALLFFDDRQRDSVRAIWRRFDDREDVEREYYAVEDGKWVKKA
ncbi:DNA polymerase III subunit chi [Tsuneonella sp. YG55]|uniref:DNA polymerase III subunit chi n=1 Tax=Tsuneonella litorea TaxID=2976475 RepID=A0A9X2W0C5_9SPHN|nr:DNA polymerase III subunit chi [Tsuneonella litorea]